MAKLHKTYRIDEGIVRRIDAYAETHGMRASEAVSHLLRIALDAESAQSVKGASKAVSDELRPETRQTDLEAVLDALRASNADLRAALLDSRATVATLTAQLSVKDQQISQAHELAGQAQKLQMADVARASLTDGTHTTIRDRIKSLFGM